MKHDFVKIHENLAVFWEVFAIQLVREVGRLVFFKEFRYFLGVIIFLSHWPSCRFMWGVTPLGSDHYTSL